MESLKVMNKINSIEQLDALGAKICELLQVGIDKANTVVPETLQQIVAWQIWGNASKLVVLVLLVIILFNITKQTAKNFVSGFDKDDELIEAGRGAVVLLGCTVIAVSIAILMFEAIPALIKSLVAPNLVIIEQLGGLVK